MPPRRIVSPHWHSASGMSIMGTFFLRLAGGAEDVPPRLLPEAGGAAGAGIVDTGNHPAACVTGIVDVEPKTHTGDAASCGMPCLSLQRSMRCSERVHLEYFSYSPHARHMAYGRITHKVFRDHPVPATFEATLDLDAAVCAIGDDTFELMRRPWNTLAALIRCAGVAYPPFQADRDRRVSLWFHRTGKSCPVRRQGCRGVGRAGGRSSECGGSSYRIATSQCHIPQVGG